MKGSFSQCKFFAYVLVYIGLIFNDETAAVIESQSVSSNEPSISFIKMKVVISVKRKEFVDNNDNQYEIQTLRITEANSILDIEIYVNFIYLFVLKSYRCEAENVLQVP